MRIVPALKVGFRTAALLRSQWWPDERIRGYVDGRLREMLDYATRHVPHYRSLGIAPDHEDPRNWLRRFPVLAREQVQDAGERLYGAGLDESAVCSSRTSGGASGEPVTTRFDERTWLTCKYALKARRVLSAVRSPWQRILIVAERPDEGALTRLFSDRIFSVRYLGIETPIAKNLQLFVDFRPTLVYGYPSYLQYFADAAEQAGYPLPPVPTIFTSSELLTPPAREKLERAYGGRLIDVYGSTEFKEIAVECPAGRYHVNFESVFVEALPDEYHGKPRLVVTSLMNRAMPLIRYDIGDHGQVAVGRCACGRQGPYIVQPQGRKSELIVFPGGRVVTSFELTTAIDDFDEVRNYSIVHRQPDELLLRIHARPALTDERRAQLVAAVSALVSPAVRVSVERLEKRLPAGKRIAVSQGEGTQP